MNNISKIVISTCRNDLRLTRICVASVRYWYPEIPIYLICDYGQGLFNTSEIEEKWNVKIFKTAKKDFGWGFAKLEPLFQPERKRFLIVDSDTVFTGPVLDELNKSSADFIVDDETQAADDIKRLYFDKDRLKEIDPSFHPSGKNFNTGQWVGMSGRLTRHHFDNVLAWGKPPILKYPECFMQADQGILNYVLEKLAHQGEISLDRVNLMLWAPRDLEHIELDRLISASPYRQVIHWAGVKKPYLKRMIRADILDFFERFYYSRHHYPTLSRNVVNISEFIIRIRGKIIYRLMKR